MVGGDRSSQHQPIVAGPRRDVARPGGPHEREALAEQEAVPRVNEVCRIVVRRCIVKLDQHAEPTAVVDLVQQGTVTAGCVHRPQHEKVSAERDQAVRIAGGKFEIGNLGIGRRRRIQCEPGATAQLLVGARRTERGSRGEVLAFQDLNPLNPCLRMRYYHRQRKQQLRNATGEFAAVVHPGWYLTRAEPFWG